MLKPNTDGKINNNKVIDVRVIAERNFISSPYLITDRNLARDVYMQFYRIIATTFLNKNKRGRWSLLVLWF